jgi:hypothetical protein
LDWFRGHRPWAQLLRVIGRLPPQSHYKAALADDDELAERSPPPVPGAPRVPLTGYSRTHELLAALLDAVNELHATLTAAHTKGGKRPPVRRTPRPVTALQRAEHRRTAATLTSIEAKMLPQVGRS